MAEFEPRGRTPPREKPGVQLPRHSEVARSLPALHRPDPTPLPGLTTGDRFLHDDRRRGEYIDPRRSRELFKIFAEKWLQTKVDKKPKTFASYESSLRVHVLPFFGAMPLASVQREDIQAWIAKMRAKGKTSSTIRKAYQTLSAILTEAELSKRIPRSPAYRIELPAPEKGTQRFLTPEQINRLADAIMPRYRVLVLVGAYLGLRWGECAGLQFADLDLRHGFALIHRTISEVSGTLHVVPTKGKPAVIPLPNFLCRELEQHIARFVGADGSVFTSPKGGPLRHNVYKRFYKPALVEAELDPQLRFHDLRHTSASIAGSRQYGGETAKVVQQLLRHSSQQVTTETYMHLFPEDMARLRESLDRVYRATTLEDLKETENGGGPPGSEAAVIPFSPRHERAGG